MYFLSKSRTDFIQTHFIGTAAKGLIPDLARFQQLRSAAELHYLADAYNWDDGVTVLDWVINSPTCDYGTALLIFWRAQPAFYTQFANEQEADEEGVFHLLQTIIHNWEAGFYKKHRIGCHPTKDTEHTSYKQPDAKWSIPAAFRRGNTGQIVVAQEAVAKWLAATMHWLKN